MLRDLVLSHKLCNRLALAAADFKRHVDDVEAGLARKTEELHQYRHKLEAELSGAHTELSTMPVCLLMGSQNCPD